MRPPKMLNSRGLFPRPAAPEEETFAEAGKGSTSYIASMVMRINFSAGWAFTVIEFIFGYKVSSVLGKTTFCMSVMTWMDFLRYGASFVLSLTLICPSTVFSIRFNAMYGCRICCIDREASGPPPAPLEEAEELREFFYPSLLVFFMVGFITSLMAWPSPLTLLWGLRPRVACLDSRSLLNASLKSVDE